MREKSLKRPINTKIAIGKNNKGRKSRKKKTGITRRKMNKNKIFFIK